MGRMWAIVEGVMGRMQGIMEGNGEDAGPHGR